MIKEFKSITGKIKDVDEAKRIVTGYYTSTGTLDSDGDIFEKGAFKKTIKERGPGAKNQIWHLWMHDHFSPINKPYLLEERAEGVYFETQFPDNPVSNMVLSLYQERALNEHSVGFFRMKEKTEAKANIILEARMLEGSSVLWGANENTPTVSMKSDIELRIKHLDNILKSCTFDAKELSELLYQELEDIKAMVTQAAKVALEPKKSPELILPKIKFNV